MVIAELTSGLGNQLFQYATARSLALKHGKRLVLDNRFFVQNKYRSPRLLYFKTGAFITLPMTKWPYLIIESLIGRKKDSIHYINEEKWWEFQLFSEDVNNKHVRLEGGWCSICYFESHASIIQREILLKKQYIKRILNRQKEMKETNSVAIHIRKGDYIESGDAANIFFNLGIDYYAKAIAYIKSKVNNPVFYVFTNDSEWVVQNFLPMFSEKFVHISALQVLEDYEEFELMRSCRHQIIANSTFSWWAAFLNSYEAKIIVQPKKWYKYVPAQLNYEKGLLIGNIGIKL